MDHIDKSVPHFDALEYEKYVFSVFQSLIYGGIGSVFMRKHYLGKRTGHNHEIDVSIEAKLARLELLILVE